MPIHYHHHHRSPFTFSMAIDLSIVVVVVALLSPGCGKEAECPGAIAGRKIQVFNKWKYKASKVRGQSTVLPGPVKARKTSLKSPLHGAQFTARWTRTCISSDAILIFIPVSIDALWQKECPSCFKIWGCFLLCYYYVLEVNNNPQ